MVLNGETTKNPQKKTSFTFQHDSISRLKIALNDIHLHFFFENLIPVLWGSKHHPFNLITFLFRGVAIAIFLLD